MATSVNEIGFAFLNIYYERMKKDPSKVSALYSNTAELTHINYQVNLDENSDTVETVKLTGKENISKFFTRNNKKVCDLKVRLDSCDMQATGQSQSNIIILTTGELFWTGTPTYKFCQAFVLQRSQENKNIFDITNDIIRFIPDSLEKYVIKQQENTPVDNSDDGPKELEGNTGIGKPKENKVNTSTVEPVSEKQAPEMDDKNQQNDKSDENVDSSKVDKQVTEQSTTKMSWASKLSSVAQKPNQVPATKTSNEESQSKNLEKSTLSDNSKKENSSNKATKKKQVFSTVNKDGFFPIYIRGTTGINEDRLKKILEKEFGNIMKITSADNFAVVDFENQKSQTDALEKKKLKIDDIEVQLERKTVKRVTSTTPSPGSMNSNSNGNANNTNNISGNNNTSSNNAANNTNANANANARQAKKHHSKKRDQ
ncbi:hypothetical protein TPHA_0M02140 [Tetrapisispora phaffii CBS 4417]|uniref:NTF2 domain-containing protein n=1 Tax=Tetrapisispora phaffii (strain ATCC 24235 / CBS 4417 / NBRC 1672 / NRRL Y-8282 / UCD 70-5) TaxID=1071381 RepID=G8C0S3_TETPH|nr:hypothetical protein TPHA_0M02140 [Tetrapisispora phaffii CBS 4417]CCE65788.1 hypothetical protein TPHA_0M02140 [Tetrapisispora phaffii CBS 4417]